MRTDLRALGPAELELLSNRGTVRRAAREADTVVITEAPDTTVTALGDDGIEVVLPPGVPIEDAHCPCPAIGLCRHIVRAVLAYAATSPTTTPQRSADDTPTAAGDPPSAAQPGHDPPTAPPDPPAPERPADPVAPPPADCAARPADPPAPPPPHDHPPTEPADLLTALPARVRAAGTRLLRAGTTATVVRTGAPAVLLHESGATVRFLVPGDLAYARCDCRDKAPCAHVVPALAALAAPGTLVELHRRSPDTRSLAELDSALALLAEAGAASGQAAVPAALQRAAAAVRAAGLPWPADVAEELAHQCTRHDQADSGFDPVVLAQLVGEAVLRADTLRHPTSPVPPLFAGGPPTAAQSPVGSARLIGLGTTVRHIGRVVEIDALVYDTGARRVLALGRRSTDPDGTDPTARQARPYHELAATSVVRDVSVAAVGAGQLVATGGMRTAAGRLRLGRRPVALGAQRYDWAELISPPVLVDGAGTAGGLAAAALPPPVRPRTAGEAVVVLAVDEAGDAGFDPTTQSINAVLRAADGDRIDLVHPWTTRGAPGGEALLHALSTGTARFVAGHLTRHGSRPHLRPCGVVVDDPDGTRRLVAPWTDPSPPVDHPVPGTPSRVDPRAGPPTVADHLLDLQAATGALLVSGVSRADRTVRRRWAHLVESVDAVGSTVLAPRVERVAAALDTRASDPRWDPVAAAAALLALAAALELALELARTSGAPDDD